MTHNLKGRHFLTLRDFSKEEIHFLLTTAKYFKGLKVNHIPHKIHDGKNVALLFEKTSTRTRCAFTVACIDLGIHPEFLGKNDIQLGKKESVKDTAKVLGRMFDGIQFRGFKHETVEELAKFAGVPVWNGLTDKYHPTQVLADFMTMEEHAKKLAGAKLVFVGDGRNNVANSLMIGAAKIGVDFVITAPEELFPDKELVAYAREIAKENNSVIEFTEDKMEAVKNADAIYTDVWVSMGEESEFENRIHLLKPYQVNMEMLKKTGNENVIFLHCLPAFHDLETSTGKEIYEKYGLTEMEVTNEVFESKYSVVFDQAENRMHTIKAVMATTLGLS